jgi:peptidoglycan-N-acetylglucosamine deacetylase
LLLLISWLLLTAMGSAFISWNYHLLAINHNKKIKQEQVSITFDDGPHPEFTPKVLELLDKYDAKATFFCIGKNIEAHPALFQELISHGHTVGNHTYSHASNFGFFSSEKVLEELEKTNKIVKELSGLGLRLYRPAFGVTNPSIKKALQQTNLKTIGWSKRSLDTTAISEKNIVNRITRNLKKGDIILLHDTSDKSVAVLERLLLFLQSNKMQAVTVNELLSIQPYE